VSGATCTVACATLLSTSLSNTCTAMSRSLKSNELVEKRIWPMAAW